MSIFKNLVGGIDDFANSINPMKQPMQWLTDNTIGKIPGVGKPGAQLYDYSNSHPLESLAAMAAIYGGAAYLGGAAGGGAGAGAAAGGAAGGAGSAGTGLTSLGTTSGFGGVGADAGATGFGAWGTTAGGADAAGLAAADSAAVGAEGAAPGLMESYGPASSSFDWQGLARQGLSSAMKNQGGSGGQYQAYPQSQDQAATQPQRLAMALMQPNSSAPYLPASQLGNAALIGYLKQKPVQTWSANKKQDSNASGLGASTPPDSNY